MSVTRHDVAHLREGTEVTVTFRRRDDSSQPTSPVSGPLDRVHGYLALGTETVVARDGNPGANLYEVVSPKPPIPAWPVGQRLTDGTRCAIRTEHDLGNRPWFLYFTSSFGDGPWLLDADVAGWNPVVDPPTLIPDERVREIVDEFNAYEATHARPNRLWPDVVLNTVEVDHPLTDAVDAPDDDVLILTDRTVLRCDDHHRWFIHYRPQEKP